MTKTRVKKGEPYYWIMNSGGCFISIYDEDNRMVIDKKRWENGNYFNTEKEADAVARKLNAVLKGADVMEDYQKEKIASLDTMLETKDEISKNYSKLLNNPKVKAVLKGADVIEMPESNEVDMIQREIGLEVGGEDEELVGAASLGAIKMINWLIDKIVK